MKEGLFDDEIIIYGDPEEKPVDWRKDLAKDPKEEIDDPEDVGDDEAVVRLLGFDPEKAWKDDQKNEDEK